MDTYHGVSVPDPYRWLEDDTSAETAAWVEAQNKVTFAHLETIPFRAALTARLEQLYNYPKFGEPFRRGTHLLLLQERRAAEPVGGLPADRARRRARGAARSQHALARWHDQAERVRGVERRPPRRLRPDARAGPTGRPTSVLDVTTKQPLTDSVEWVKVSGAAWAGDGFFYSRYPAPEKGKELSTKNVDHQVFFHRLGTPQSADELVFSDPANPERFHTVDTTEDERFLILTVSDRGKGKKGNAVYYRDLAVEDHDASRRSSPRSATTPSTSSTTSATGSWSTPTARRPNGRVFLFDPKTPAESAWKDVLPERPEPLDGVGHGRRQALRHLPEGRHLARLRLRPRRQAGARDRSARARARCRAGRPRRRHRGVLHLHVVQLPADDLQVRRRDQGSRRRSAR